MKQLGLLFDNLGPDQTVYETICKLDKMEDKSNICLFFKNLCLPVLTPPVQTLSIDKIFFYNANLVCFDFDNIIFLLKSYMGQKKFFYVTDMEWSKIKKDYLYNYKLLNDPRLQIICPSKEYAFAIKNYCGRDSIIMKELDLDEIRRI